MDPQPCAVHRLADPRQARQEQQRDRPDAEEVLVRLEHAVVASQRDQRDRECRDADHHPEALLERVVRPEPVDLGQADRGQEAGHRQQVRVGVRHGDARDDVRGQVERDEERGVGERAPPDHGLARDVDAREAEAGQGPDRGQVSELPVSLGHRGRAFSTSRTIAAARSTITRRAIATRSGEAFSASSLVVLAVLRALGLGLRRRWHHGRRAEPSGLVRAPPAAAAAATARDAARARRPRRPSSPRPRARRGPRRAGARRPPGGACPRRRGRRRPRRPGRGASRPRRRHRLRPRTGSR